MVVGAFMGGPMSSLGRWKSIIIMCIVGIVGNVMTFFFMSYPVLLFGKFLSGLSAGGINVFCPKYIMESSPKEVSGSAGAIFQLAVTFGIVLNALIALPFGDALNTDDRAETRKNLFNVLSALPIVCAVLQIIFMSLVFRNDTPVVMMEKGQEQETREFFLKLYNDEQILEERINDLRANLAGS